MLDMTNDDRLCSGRARYGGVRRTEYDLSVIPLDHTGTVAE